MRAERVIEAPISMDPAEPNNPLIHSHEKANPATLKDRIMRTRGQLKDLAQRAESNDLATWEGICRDAKGGMFMGLEQNLEQIRHGIAELAAQRKKGGVMSRGIDKNIGEKFDGGGEYNDEVGMIKNDLHTIVRCASDLNKMLHKDENIAEWAQEKIAVVKSMMVTVLDYIASEHEMGHEYTVSESINEWKKSTKAPVRPKNPVAKAHQAVGTGSGSHKNKSKEIPRKAKHKKKPEISEGQYDKLLQAEMSKIITD